MKSPASAGLFAFGHFTLYKLRMVKGISIRIEELGLKGDGIGRLPDGRRVFVAGALPGEEVALAGIEDRPEGVSGKLERIVTASPERAEPPCAHFGACGGCGLQHMSPERYRDFKFSRVTEALARAGLQAEQSEGPFISPPGSRRRAVLSAKCAQAGQVQLGFNERASHRLVEIEACAVLRPPLAALLSHLRAFLPRIMRGGESYDVAIAESGGLTDILITVLGKQGRDRDRSVTAALQELADAAGIIRVSWQASRSRQIEVVVQKGAYTVNFGGYRLEPPPGAFLQATEEGERALTGFALESLGRKSRVADLYAGCGTFAFALLGNGHKVDAFEGDGPALDALAAAGAGLAQLRTARRDLAREPLTFQELKAYDAVVIDPPRTGAHRQAEEIAGSAISRVISISCNPDTFARDGAILTQTGFKLKRLRVVDQFLWSPHVEVAGLFVKG